MIEKLKMVGENVIDGMRRIESNGMNTTEMSEVKKTFNIETKKDCCY